MGGAAVQNTVRVYNGRGNKDLTLDKASFELVECPTALSTEDFYAMAAASGKDKAVQLQQQYIEEVSDFIKEKLKCDKVSYLHHQIRNAAKVGTPGIAGYAGGGPHTDSSAVSADELAMSMCTGEKFERYLYVNLWRNISVEPIENDHLAMVDERTVVKPDDYIVKDLFGDGYTVIQYGLSARHAEHHKWYFFPRMEKHEGILFKQMDSDWTKSGRVCFHMSVADPDLAGNATIKSRESIEIRFVCFWKKADSGVDSMPTEKNTNKFMVKDPETYARELRSGTSISSASVWDLTKALVVKLPLLGRLALLVCGSPDVGHSHAAGITYSGKPEDYLDKFTTVVDSFPTWPAFAVDWVQQQIMAKPLLDEGIAALTLVLVTDSQGYQGTKAFKTKEHKEITEYLLKQDKYMSVARKHWRKFKESK